MSRITERESSAEFVPLGLFLLFSFDIASQGRADVAVEALGFLGFFDDYAKVTKQTDAGVSAKVRLLIEFLVAALAGAFIMGIYGAHTPLGHHSP